MRFTALLALLVATVTAAPTGSTITSSHSSLAPTGPKSVGRSACKSSILHWYIFPHFDFGGPNTTLEMYFYLHISTSPKNYYGQTKRFTYYANNNVPQETHKSKDGKFKVKHGNPEFGKAVTLVYGGKRYFHGAEQASFGDAFSDRSYQYWGCIDV
ncbi:hypothetical protein BG015_011649 [Linnemannia schmuckeri]|uniref:Uncharacterized protein n=1 Tax=Linnemannia schmuckeri TaxID=64567 RepID=A0A9P5RUF5_9FUNG|nr:hypothetical protein BG015_011649 [Linnemannia schmuckeri]